jgi:hypothetical protein
MLTRAFRGPPTRLSAFVTTQPGSKSQQSVQKQGFELLYTRAILVRTA